MMDVQTREGIFGGGAYGGGVFDGSNMGFGGLGFVGMGAFPAPSKYPNGYPGSTYTTKSGETGGSISRDITGNANRWNELLAKNPETKSTQYGMAFNPGKVLKLPTSWQATAAAVPVVHTDSPSTVTPSASSETEPSSTPAASTASFVPADDDGMSTTTIVGLVGAVAVAGYFIMRKK